MRPITSSVATLVSKSKIQNWRWIFGLQIVYIHRTLNPKAKIFQKWRGFCLKHRDRVERFKLHKREGMAGKKFRFSLESVLKLRKHETERARQHLGRVARERQEQEEHVRHMRHRLMSFGGAVTGVIDPVALQRQAAFRQDARHRYEQARTELATRQQREGQAREALRQKHGAEESLHILREKEEAVHKKAQQDAEGAFLDEQAISGFFRKQSH